MPYRCPRAQLYHCLNRAPRTPEVFSPGQPAGTQEYRHSPTTEEESLSSGASIYTPKDRDRTPPGQKRVTLHFSEAHSVYPWLSGRRVGWAFPEFAGPLELPTALESLCGSSSGDGRVTKRQPPKALLPTPPARRAALCARGFSWLSSAHPVPNQQDAYWNRKLGKKTSNLVLFFKTSDVATLAPRDPKNWTWARAPHCHGPSILSRLPHSCLVSVDVPSWLSHVQ